jgi:hypothetical protein
MLTFSLAAFEELAFFLLQESIFVRHAVTPRKHLFHMGAAAITLCWVSNVSVRLADTLREGAQTAPARSCIRRNQMIRSRPLPRP